MSEIKASNTVDKLHKILSHVFAAIIGAALMACLMMYFDVFHNSNKTQKNATKLTPKMAAKVVGELFAKHADVHFTNNINKTLSVKEMTQLTEHYAHSFVSWLESSDDKALIIKTKVANIAPFKLSPLAAQSEFFHKHNYRWKLAKKMVQNYLNFDNNKKLYIQTHTNGLKILVIGKAVATLRSDVLKQRDKVKNEK